MNPHQKPQEDVVVTQEDRDAAASLVVPHGRWPGFPADFHSGRADQNELTQLLARHRLLGHEAGRCDMREAAGWQPIETAPKEVWLKSQQVLTCHADKRWTRFGRYYGEMKRWYYSGTSERSQWSEVEGDAPTHWMPFPALPTEFVGGEG